MSRIPLEHIAEFNSQSARFHICVLYEINGTFSFCSPR